MLINGNGNFLFLLYIGVKVIYIGVRYIGDRLYFYFRIECRLNQLNRVSA